MRIGIEAQRIFRKNKHGMDYVVLEEIRRIQQMKLNDEFYIFVAPGNDHCLSESSNVHIVEIKCPTYPLWEQVALPIIVKRFKLDLLHCTSNTAPVFCKVPLIITLHDIIFLEKRDSNNKSLYQNLGWYYRRLVVPRILSSCKAIITVSDFEKNNISAKLPFLSDCLVRIYNGYNDWFKPIKNYLPIVKRYIPDDGYFFFLGNTDPKKNTLRTLKAFQLYSKKSQCKRKLLVADLSKLQLDRLIKENDLEDIRANVVLTGYVLNSDLPYLYNGAFAFLYTSLRESFGIPLLEALACGCPVITSNTSSMPEIAADAAMFVCPECVEEIAEAMLRLEHEDVNLSSQRGIERAKHFSWENTAKELVELYNKVLHIC